MKRLTLMTLTALLAMAMNSSAWWWTRKPAEEPVKEDVPEATQEAVLNAMLAAPETVGRDGNRRPSLADWLEG